MDDLLEEIRQKLSDISDGNMFEEFAWWSLTKVIPGLAPVSGGGDFGRDGEAPDAFLTCTIQEKVIGNMAKSISNYKASGGEAATVYVATSQKLTNAKKDNLRKKAKDFGLTLPVIYDAEWFVRELYFDDEWRLKLLGISGELPALSRIPVHSRAVLDIPMVGRVDVMKSLEDTQGDVLISGQPGSGKTYVATEFAERHGGLFVIDDNATKIANELRKKTPSLLLIDDVHNKESLLDSLKHLRTELKLDFRIVGISWISGEKSLKNKMSIGDASVIRIRELTKDQIVEVIDACGLKNASNTIKREIVDQSKGKPGLAITLSSLCLAGDWERVFNGDSLYDLVTSNFSTKLGEDVTALLSFIALGGESGVTLSNLTEMSSLSIVKVKAILAELSYGGVITDKQNSAVSIQPNSLRYPLVRELFVDGIGVLEFEQYIDKYVLKDDVIETLLITALKGATLDSSRIKPYMDGTLSKKTWSYYAALGKSEAEYVAQTNPDAITDVPEPVLATQPEIAVRELILAANGDHRELHPYPSHPIRVLDDWAASAKPGYGIAIKRRSHLLKAIGELLDNGYSDHLTAGRVIAASLNPHYQDTNTDPGSGMSMTFEQGYISLDELKQMANLVADAKDIYGKLEEDKAFNEVISAVDHWVYDRQTTSAEYLDVISDTKQNIAKTLLTDLAIATEGRHLLQRRIRQLGNAAGMDIKVSTPKEYEVLFPYESRSFAREEALYKKQIEAAKRLAEEWATEDPRYVVTRITELQEEVDATSTVHPNYLHYIHAFLAESVPRDDLATWIDLFVDNGKSVDFSGSFAIQLAKHRQGGYRTLLKKILKSDMHAGGAVSAIVTQFTATEEPELFDLIKPLLGKHVRYIDIACIREEVPLENELFILDNITEDAAVKICRSLDFEYSKEGSNKVMPEELKARWSRAIVTHSTTDRDVMSDLKHLLDKHPELSLLWFEDKVNQNIDPKKIWKLRTGDIAKKLAKHLSDDDRRRLLSVMDASAANYSLVEPLVGDDPENYRALTSNQKAVDFHLKPLNVFSANWVPMVSIALQYGQTPDDIQDNSFPSEYSWSDSEHVMWQGKIADIDEQLSTTDDPTIRGILLEFRRDLENRSKSAEEKEYRQAVEGR